MNEHERLIEILKRARREGEVSPEVHEENLRRLIRAAMPPVEASYALRERVLREMHAARVKQQATASAGHAPRLFRCLPSRWRPVSVLG